MELAVFVAEARVIEDMMPVFAHDGGTGEALGLIRREAEEDFIDNQFDK